MLRVQGEQRTLPVRRVENKSNETSGVVGAVASEDVDSCFTVSTASNLKRIRAREDRCFHHPPSEASYPVPKEEVERRHPQAAGRWHSVAPEEPSHLARAVEADVLGFKAREIMGHVGMPPGGEAGTASERTRGASIAKCSRSPFVC